MPQNSKDTDKYALQSTSAFSFVLLRSFHGEDSNVPCLVMTGASSTVLACFLKPSRSVQVFLVTVFSGIQSCFFKAPITGGSLLCLV